MQRPRLLYLLTEDWYFIGHRMPVARAARDAGYEVHVATRVREHGRAIEDEDFHLHPVEWHRGSVNPVHLARTIGEVRRLYRSLKQDLLHHIGLQAAVVGSLASWDAAIPQINAFVGLGHAFSSNSPKALFARTLLQPVLPYLVGRPWSLVMVENTDDKNFMAAMGVKPERIVIFAGTGVDPDEFKVLPEPDESITIAFVGRLIEDKGVRRLIAAHELLAKRGRPVRLLLAGRPDSANPSSIPLRDIAEWQTKPGIHLLGYVADVSAVWAQAHIAVLPSRREGLPLSLVEAASCGRPLVATDVPGCREIARPGVNALLVPPNDAAALADAIDRLAGDAALRHRFGAASRRIVVEEFDSRIIKRNLVELYNSMIEGRDPTAPH